MIKSKFLSDFSNIAQGAFSTVNAIKEELDALRQAREYSILHFLLNLKTLVYLQKYIKIMHFLI